MNLKLIEFIKNNPDNWRTLLSSPPYCIDIKEDDNYILFKYNQIESDFHNDIVKECRGIILNKKTYEPVCIPFFKFGNYGESYADKIDWNTARVQTKIDGSIMKVWYDKEIWRISTNGVINAKNCNTSTEKSFNDIFMECWKNSVPYEFNTLSEKFNKNYTYMFEMTHPLNRVVIKYDKPMIYHIGTRDNITGLEINIDINIEKPKEYKFNSLEDVISMSKELPYSEEGYVVVDEYYHRVKIKSPAYVAVHRLKNNGAITYKRIIELLFANENEEFLVYFDEYRSMFDSVKLTLDKYISDMIPYINKIKDMKFDSKKEYAMEVLKTPISNFLFEVYKGNYKWDEFDKYIRKIPVDRLVDILKLKEAKEIIE